MIDKPRLLLVDDEERILRSLALLFRGQYRLRMTTDAREALRLLAEEPAEVVISDQRMPLMTGAEFLREVRARHPNTLRILLTGYSELDAVVASVNEGEIFRFVNKPWDARQLRETVDQAAAIARSLMQPAAPLATVMADDTAVAVLVLDDDPEVAETVRSLLGTASPVIWARTLDEALEALACQPVGVVVSEVTVAGQRVTGLLKTLKAEHPSIVSLVLTPFQDIGLFISLINQGQVYRLLPKPLRRGPLGMSLQSALRHHEGLRRAPHLHQAHQVEAISDAAELSVADRVITLLARLRGRPARS